jgi:hypothetical protein
MPVGLAGGGWDRVRAAQCGEGGLGVQPLRVVAGDDQDGCGAIGPDPEDVEQLRCGAGRQACDVGLQRFDLGAQLEVTSGKQSQRVLGDRSR